jgi:DNA mismatch endonuclease (patch repair protein)
MDRLTRENRSRLMSRISGKDTLPELAVRSVLHRLDYRFTLHGRDLPGRPDLVFPSRRKVVFVHGCYWHGHDCRQGRAQSKSNVEFWAEKLAGNMARDRRNVAALRRLGWRVEIVWQCELKDGTWLERILRFLC